MRFLLFVIALAVIVPDQFAIASPQRSKYEGNWGDFLNPVDRSDVLMERFRRLMDKKLGSLTPFDCGRAMHDTGLGPENYLSVYSKIDGKKRTYFVTNIKTDTPGVWQRTDMMSRPERAKMVKLHRKDAEIPEPIALNIREIWITMIREARPYRKVAEAEIETVFAGTDEFSIQQTNGSPLRAELRLPPSGERTDLLDHLHDDLYLYCVATPKKRSAVAKMINDEAIKLLALLHSDQRDSRTVDVR
jgi:hypothetical protein